MGDWPGLGLREGGQEALFFLCVLHDASKSPVTASGHNAPLEGILPFWQEPSFVGLVAPISNMKGLDSMGFWVPRTYEFPDL